MYSMDGKLQQFIETPIFIDCWMVRPRSGDCFQPDLDGMDSGWIL